MATEFVAAIKTTEIPADSVKAIDVRGTRIAVANVGGAYYAFDDACTHEQCSLAEEGEMTGTTVTCTCHGSEFEADGSVRRGPAPRALDWLQVSTTGGAIVVDEATTVPPGTTVSL